MQDFAPLRAAVFPLLMKNLKSTINEKPEIPQSAPSPPTGGGGGYPPPPVGALVKRTFVDLGKSCVDSGDLCGGIVDTFAGLRSIVVKFIFTYGIGSMKSFVQGV